MKSPRLIFLVVLGILVVGAFLYPKTSTVQHQILIKRPLAEVYEYVTTPGNWPDWHPSSLGVSGQTDHSLEVGEKVTEAFRVVGREGEVVWTVTEKETPIRWKISGDIIGREGAGGDITYALTESEGGTLFERTFEYTLPHYGYFLLNVVYYRRKVNQESRAAVEALKGVLEGEN